jgi:regulator of protease activity HflC (stomatin/prohibitin superfamily)
LVLLIPFIDKMVRVSLRTITTDVPPQDVITRDNVSVKVNAAIARRRWVAVTRRNAHAVFVWLRSRANVAS